MRAALTLLLLMAALVGAPQAATYLVRPDGTGDFPTIQAAINATADGDSVLLANGTYTGDGNRDIQFGGRAITVRAIASNPDSCVIDCQGSASSPRRGFSFIGEQSGAVLSGITVRNGYQTYGGGVHCSQASPSIIGCQFINNNAVYDGGGVFCGQSMTPTFQQCVFMDNAVASKGGGASVHESEAVFQDCSFTGNSSAAGGGVYVVRGTCTLENCILDWNCASGGGGGVSIDTGHITALDCSMVGNFSYGSMGGCVFAFESEGTFQGCTVALSYVDGKGGGFYLYCGTYDITGCTLVRNLASETGGGVRVHDNTTASFANTIIAFTLEGGAVRPEALAVVDFSCCDIFGNVGGDWVGPIAAYDGMNFNFTADPCFCDLNGGDYHLWNYSPCNQQGLCDLIGAWPVGCTEPQASEPIGGDVPALARLTCYPSPATTRAHFLCRMPTAGAADVALRIVDAGGRLVRLLPHTGAPSSVSIARWDLRDASGRAVPAGAYYARLEADGATLATARTLVVR